ncbi:MAG: hypothetical protein WC438_03510 [Candidatus Pacearchaeota archaeon]
MKTNYHPPSAESLGLTREQYRLMSLKDLVRYRSTRKIPQKTANDEERGSSQTPHQTRCLFYHGLFPELDPNGDFDSWASILA